MFVNLKICGYLCNQKKDISHQTYKIGRGLVATSVEILFFFTFGVYQT